jgi:hypothetical protein
MDIMEQCL